MRNYSRFYAYLKECGGDEETKELIVSSYTDHRTVHLHEMTDAEYRRMCDDLSSRSEWRARLRAKRSECLHLMQLIGLDTSDWGIVNRFCENPRISGKPFARMTIDELKKLSLRLRAIAAREVLVASVLRL